MQAAVDAVKKKKCLQSRLFSIIIKKSGKLKIDPRNFLNQIKLIFCLIAFNSRLVIIILGCLVSIGG